MWVCTGQSIQMVEGDFGIELPLSVNGVTFTERDELRIKIARGEDVLITKTFSSITDNTVRLVLSEPDSALLPIGAYQYSLGGKRRDPNLRQIQQQQPVLLRGKPDDHRS